MTAKKRMTTGKGKAKKARVNAAIGDLDVKRAAGYVRGGTKQYVPPKHISTPKYED